MHRKAKMKLFHCLLVMLSFLAMTIHAQAAPEKTIKIGIIGPMKFIHGENHWWGATIAADEINASGGVSIKGVPYKIELVKADSNELRSIPDAVSAMQRLIDAEKVNFVTGSVRSEAALAMSEESMDKKVIFAICGAVSAGRELSERLAKGDEKAKYVFLASSLTQVTMIEPTAYMMDMVAKKVRKELGVKTPRVAIMMESTMSARRIANCIREWAPKMGLEVVCEVSPSSMASDVTAELNAIEKSGAHIIVTGFSGPVGVATARKWGQLKIPAALVGCNPPSQRKGYWDYTNKFCNYELAWGAFGPVAISDKTIPFVKKFEQKHNDYPIWTAGTYDVIYIFKDAIERAGTLDTDAVVAELEKTDYIGAQGRMAFNPRGHKNPHESKTGPGYLTGVGNQWQDGRLVTVWPDGSPGNPAVGDKAWEKGVKYEGTQEYKLPPWMVEYWKNKKNN